MKVVLFCGGMGMRIREYSDRIPKPMVPIGPRPIIWHVMKWYADRGHHDFVLALGYKGDVIKRYFLDYQEWVSNDVTIRGGQVEIANTDLDEWSISFVDTGHRSPIGERLRRVRSHLEGEEMFLANYSDNLTDLPLDRLLDTARSTAAVATFAAVRPSASFHIVRLGDDHLVKDVEEARDAGLWINGGYFALTPEVFDHLHEGEDLVGDALPRLREEGRVAAYAHDGFWASMDTFKEREDLDAMYRAGGVPWERDAGLS